MFLKDLKGKTIYELDRADFEKLFCEQCKEYLQCPRNDLSIKGCQLLVDSGVYDSCLRKRADISSRELLGLALIGVEVE